MKTKENGNGKSNGKRVTRYRMRMVVVTSMSNVQSMGTDSRFVRLWWTRPLVAATEWANERPLMPSRGREWSLWRQSLDSMRKENGRYGVEVDVAVGANVEWVRLLAHRSLTDEGREVRTVATASKSCLECPNRTVNVLPCSCHAGLRWMK